MNIWTAPYYGMHVLNWINIRPIVGPGDSLRQSVSHSFTFRSFLKVSLTGSTSPICCMYLHGMFWLSECCLRLYCLYTHSKVEKVWYNCLQLGHIGPGGWWQRYWGCILYQVWDYPPKEFKFMQWSHLYSSSSPKDYWLSKRGSHHGRWVDDESPLACNVAGLMQRLQTRRLLHTWSCWNYLGGTQTARSPTALGQLEDDEDSGEPRWILIL